ncbi:OmpH family outer membrane protein [Desulfurispirillum indicum]|uniref:OmpH family outer membrane protein n=1 Tax=Desulfurispirillum indicum TaxID=936456 RepID=UPI001CFBA4CE|nr:OmpH family outer membrane protein [Desulfurispirillum indicum]UCZ55683.1 OmpH family outer membrane protein [Desulfurispirillum indicum]
MATEHRTIQILIVFLMLALMIPATVMAQQGGDCRYGYIDVQRAIDSSRSGSQAIEKVKQEFEQKRKVIEERKAELARVKERLDSNLGTMSESERKRSVDMYNVDLLNLRNFVEDANRQLEAQERTLTSRIVSEISALVHQYGQENNYCYIFELKTSGILYANEAQDITSIIVRLYDQQQNGRNSRR